jgi:uncharacterized protein (TIGR02265 family)
MGQTKQFIQKTDVVNSEGICPVLEITGLDRNPEVIQYLRRNHNFDVKRPPAAIPLDTVIEIQRYLARYLYPGLPLSAALWKLGRVTFEGYRRSLVGRVMLAALHLWGPHRAINNAPRIYEMTMKYGIRTVKKVGPTKYELRHQYEPGNIELLAGNIEAGLEAAGAKNLRVKIRPLAPDDHILDIEWDE